MPSKMGLPAGTCFNSTVITQGLKVGDHVRVKLIHTDVQRGFIDFARA
jgi:hypothetical protein